MQTYILDHHDIVPEPDITKWAQWFEEADRQVALTNNGVVCVSTVFIGIDSNPLRSNDDRPVVFETMTFFTGEFSEARRRFDPDFSVTLDTQRWHDWEEAERGHEEVCRAMFSRLDQFKKGPVAELVASMRTDRGL